MTVSSTTNRWSYACLAVLGVFAAAPALGQTVCLGRDEMLRQLRSDFGERPLWQGQGGQPADDSPTIVEILVNPDGSSWTILYSLPNGVSCLMATGGRWNAPSAAPSDGRKS